MPICHDKSCNQWFKSGKAFEKHYQNKHDENFKAEGDYQGTPKPTLEQILQEVYDPETKSLRLKK